MVSAWATANHVSLGQLRVDGHSNEIEAVGGPGRVALHCEHRERLSKVSPVLEGPK